MADAPTFAFPSAETERTVGGVTVRDRSDVPKWRIWETEYDVPMGRALLIDDSLILAVAPNEWIVVGTRPAGSQVVDLTHVRAMFRVSGPDARRTLTHLCALDLGDEMTPNGAAARTLVAGVATELVRDDSDGNAAYLLLMSRSFAGAVWERLVEVAESLEA